VVKRLCADGHRVTSTDLDTAANRKKGRAASTLAELRFADLTDDDAVDRLVTDVAPAVIVHLAAVIPPAIYRNPRLARRVNVDATVRLVQAAEALKSRPRFVLASSNAVWGARNPHTTSGSVGVDEPARPTDLYGAQKLEAEQRVRSSELDWIVLRLGGVISVDPKAMPFDSDALFFQSCLPSDGRVHMVDVRDVATAVARAVAADVVGEVLLIGGDASHKLRQGQVGPELAAARGMTGVLPVGRPGNPGSDVDWFVTEWMDTTRAQEVLEFQHHPWPRMVAEMRDTAGWMRHVMKCVAPVARRFTARKGAYPSSYVGYADPWAAIRQRLGEPKPDANGIREGVD